MYMNPYAVPYSITIYTPLYLHLVELACKILSVDYITNIHRIFVAGRIISFGFTILGLFYVYSFAKKQLQQTAVIWFVSALYLLLLTGHSFAVRPDSMKIAFFILFLFYYVDYFFESGTSKSGILSMLFALISVAAKQDALIYILLIQGISILFLRNIKGIKYIVIFITATACLFMLFHIMYGKFCLSSLFLFNLQGISDYQESYNLMIALFNAFRLSPFFILFIYGMLVKKSSKKTILLKVFSMIGIFAGILSSFFLFRPGSYLNYTYELIVISVFTLIFFLKESQYLPKNIIILSLFYVLFIFTTNTFLNIHTINFSKEKEFRNRYTTYYQLRNELKPYLQKKETIFNPDLQLSIFLADYNVIYGQEYHLDRLIYGLLGLTSSSKLLYVASNGYDKIFTNGDVDYLLIKNNKTSKEVVEKYYPSYSVLQQKGGFIIYKMSALSKSN